MLKEMPKEMLNEMDDVLTHNQLLAFKIYKNRKIL